MKFNFKAQRSDGSIYEGTRESANENSLARELEAQGSVPIKIEPISEKRRLDFKGFTFRRISIHEKIVFARGLGGMIQAGLSVSRALSVLERQTRNKRLKIIIADITQKISSGSTLSQSMEPHNKVFSPIFISMVSAGEEGGNLGPSLLEIASQLDRAYYLQRKVKGALMYPAIVLGVLVLIGVLMMIFVVPGLTVSFKEFNIDLPLSTTIIIKTSEFASEHTLAFLGVFIAVVLSFWGITRTKAGKRGLDFISLRIPLLGPLVKEVNAARTGNTLASLLQAGVPVANSVGITANVLKNSYYRDVLLKARESIQKGDTISSILKMNENIYPAFLSEMVAVGEETGKMSEMLRDAGNFFEGEVDQKTKDLSSLIEPLLMVFVGAIVGFFAFAMILPAYTLMNSI